MQLTDQSTFIEIEQNCKHKIENRVDHAYFNETNQSLLILKPLFGNTVLYQGFLGRPLDHNPLTIPKPERSLRESCIPYAHAIYSYDQITAPNAVNHLRHDATQCVFNPFPVF